MSQFFPTKHCHNRFNEHNNQAVLKKTIVTLFVQRRMFKKEKSRMNQRLKYEEGKYAPCHEIMSTIMDLYGVNYAVQECKQVFELFQVKPNDQISLNDFIATWISKHEIMMENALHNLFKKLDWAECGSLQAKEIKVLMGDYKGTMDEKWVEYLTTTFKKSKVQDIDQFQSTFISSYMQFENVIDAKRAAQRKSILKNKSAQQQVTAKIRSTPSNVEENGAEQPGGDETAVADQSNLEVE